MLPLLQIQKCKHFVSNSILEARTNVTKKRDQIQIKDEVTYKWKYRTKEARLIIRSGIFIYLHFGGHGLPSSGSYNGKVKLRRHNLK